MRTVIIDVTSFDQDETTKDTRVVYGFGQQHLDTPLRTIQALVANPSAFRDGEYKAILTEGQNSRFLAYLKAGSYRCTDFASNGKPHILVAFSYGENPDVNMELARIVERAIADIVPLRVFVQWEIANILCERKATYRSALTRIDFDYDRDYITSVELVERVRRTVGDVAGLNLFVVCQAWHAPRCIQICSSQGFNVVRGEFFDGFSASDPQKWVRNWLAWVMKEGSKK